MMSEIRCDIVSAETEIYSGNVTLIVASGVAGELGIHPRHAPLMTQLRPGPVRVVPVEGEELVYFVGGGVLEVMPHLITVLADTAIRADDLDEAAAIRAKEEAERQISERTSEMEFLEAELMLKNALAQLRAVELVRLRGKKIKQP
jgi:F-type H+-transporting ATPase subunit epsilon